MIGPNQVVRQSLNQTEESLQKVRTTKAIGWFGSADGEVHRCGAKSLDSQKSVLEWTYKPLKVERAILTVGSQGLIKP
jgi:hypothetical protein